MKDMQNRPAIAGVSQSVQRCTDPTEAVEPLALMERALRAAADDAGAPALLGELNAIYVPQGLWKYGDPGRLLGKRVGATSVATVLGAVSGHIVQVLVDRACAEIAAGKYDVVAIVGGESENSKRRLERSGTPLHWDEEIPGEPDDRVGFGHYGMNRREFAAGIVKPSVMFSLCDTALRHRRGETPAEHRTRIAALSSRMSAVAADNPNAWIQRHISADEIREPSPENRLVSYPYTKLMTSNIAVDQAGALLICSEATARKHGIPTEKLVYLQAATEMNEISELSERERLDEHPGMVIAAQRLLEIGDLDPQAAAHVDLYSCFPFAVQAGAAALGLDEARPLTVTGGLTFSGGPFANYVIQATARMVELLRASPGERGLVGSVGGAFAKFAFGLYSTDPGDRAQPLVADVSEEYAKTPRRKSPASYDGPAWIESYSVDVLRDGTAKATFSTLTAAEERVWACSEDPDWIAELLNDEEACGHDVHVRDGEIASR